MVRQERAVRTRLALIGAAGDCFDRYGYEATSLSLVSEVAGVTKGALSFHFSSKADLADAVEGRAFTAARAAVGSIGRSGAPALQGVIDLTHALGRQLDGDPVARAGLRLARERAREPEPARRWERVERWEPPRGPQDARWQEPRRDQVPWQGQAHRLGAAPDRPGPDPGQPHPARPPMPDWHSAWEPTVRILLREARSDRSLRPEVAAPAAEALVEYLLLGSEYAARRPGRGGPGGHSRPGGTSGPDGNGGRSEGMTRVWRLVLPALTPARMLPKLRAEGTPG
ncbi:hypothetical protein GCM10010440_34050 [Kitasatospora cinereorecta]